MDANVRLLNLATVPLYVGPLLAGISGMGWYATPVFIALIALWFVIMRPHHWPRQMQSWTSGLAVSAAAQVAINALVVVMLFGIGRGIGGVAGVSLGLPPFVPVALSFLAIPLSRMVWNPASVDSGLPAPADPVLSALLDLPGDADPTLTADAIDAAMHASGATTRLSMLEQSLDAEDAARSGLREGFILWATDPARRKENRIAGLRQAAFRVARRDPHLMALFAERALSLLHADPGLWPSFPDPASLDSAGEDTRFAAAREDLRALADALQSGMHLHPNPRNTG
jgi:hypothetical protein